MQEKSKPSRRRLARINPKTIRVIVLMTVIQLVLLGEIGKLGFGNLNSFTVAGISLISPLEFLEATLASRALLPPAAWIAAIVVLGAAVLLGRFFCAWVCPFALLRIVFEVKETAENAPRLEPLGTLGPRRESRAHPLDHAGDATSPRIRKSSIESGLRYTILGGVLGLSGLVRVPIFLLAWPATLVFGSLFALVRLFETQQPSLELVVFPALLGIELACKSWCRSICPLGSLLALASSLNRLFRPVVNPELCLISKGVNCQACRNACAEKVDLTTRPGTTALMNCTKCLDCSSKCPVRAISFPLLTQPPS